MLQSMKALLVEDEGFTREGLVLLIRAVMPELEVQAVGSLDEAQRALEKTEFSFIFLDIELNEDRSGLDFLDDLKQDGIATPVIMLSNRDHVDTVFDAIRRGAYGFLPKQTEQRETIRHAVEVVLKGGVYLPPSIHDRSNMTRPPQRVPRTVTVRKATAEDLGLTPRVYEAVYWVAQGLKNKAIGRKMNSISDNSVAELLQRAYQKLQVANRQELMTLLNRRAMQLAPPPASPAPPAPAASAS
jgi:two-component system, NarL family, nitrate/nitrite response regulator NarL